MLMTVHFSIYNLLSNDKSIHCAWTIIKVYAINVFLPKGFYCYSYLYIYVFIVLWV